MWLFVTKRWEGVRRLHFVTNGGGWWNISKKRDIIFGLTLRMNSLHIWPHHRWHKTDCLLTKSILKIFEEKKSNHISPIVAWRFYDRGSFYDVPYATLIYVLIWFLAMKMEESPLDCDTLWQMLGAGSEKRDILWQRVHKGKNNRKKYDIIYGWQCLYQPFVDLANHLLYWLLTHLI